MSKRVFVKSTQSARTLLATTLSLAIGLVACAPTQNAAVDTPVSGSDQSESLASAAPSADASEAVTKVYAKDGVAIGGADPVAYFTQSTFVEGNQTYTHDWQGVTWQFSSAENRDLFAASPEQYAPQYGGHCAWAVAARNSLVPIDPSAWKVVDGKLYLNANKRVQSNWEKDIPGFIAQADQNWPELSL